MRILVACEESQEVTIAFRERGHEAFSCDIQPVNLFPEWHMHGSALKFLHDEQWDMLVAFPPCTHLAASGARYWAEKRASGQQQGAENFFLLLAEADVPKIAIENPVGIMSTRFRKPDQIIQPWQFGHPESKRTCLWLKGLPKLEPTNILTARKQWENQTPSGQNKLGPSPDRARIRSRTYKGIAEAMAEQWG